MASPTYAVVAVLFALGVALSLGFLLWLNDADLFAGSSGGAEAAQLVILPLIYLAGLCGLVGNLVALVIWIILGLRR